MKATEQVEVAIVGISGKRYGLPVACVRELLPMVEPTPVPAWPDVALGVMTVRGEPIPLVDVSSCLGLPPCRCDSKQNILRVDAVGRSFCVVIEALEQIAQVDFTPKAQLAPTVILHDSPLCQGLGHLDAQSLVVLDPDGLFSSLEIPAPTPLEAP
jgi:chemotaxis signal transduction protein